jgi:transcriptional regulator with XRE-family HTH domain
MGNTYSLNTQALRDAATEAGHVHDDGKLNISAISKRSGVDRGVLSRVVRDENGPDLNTVVELATAYDRTIESLIVRRNTPRPARRRTKHTPASANVERAA